MVEEGCENELERSRQTIQSIRQSRMFGLDIVVEEQAKKGSSSKSNESKSKSGSKSGGSKESQDHNSSELDGARDGNNEQKPKNDRAQKDFFVQSTGEDLFSHLEQHD